MLLVYYNYNYCYKRVCNLNGLNYDFISDYSLDYSLGYSLGYGLGLGYNSINGL